MDDVVKPSHVAHPARMLQLPLPGGGATPTRHRLLAECARVDLSQARIAEAHTDALAILAEAGRQPRAGALYGVWASEGPQGQVTAVRQSDGAWHLAGTKRYCSGATFLDAALVTARWGEQVLLFDVPVDQAHVRAEPSTWATGAMADTATGPVAFNDLVLPPDRLLGGENWYLTRPGFWHGALGPAACWAGGALSLVDGATKLNRRDAHSRAHIGALQAAAWGMLAYLDQAGREIDADPQDKRGEARRRALMARHLIERGCVETLDRFGRASGPQLLAYDEHLARQCASLTLYIRQCHAERDLEAIAE